MPHQKIIVSFSRYKEADLSVKAQIVINNIMANPVFANPMPALPIVQAAATDYSEALTEAARGIKVAIIQKRQKRKTLESMLRMLALYVEIIANGDVAILVSSGFDVSKLPEPIGMLPKPQDLRAMPVNKGMMQLRWQGVKGADTYLFEYTTAPASEHSEWIQLSTTRTRLLLTGLQSGLLYAFRVAALGTHPGRIYSDEVRRYSI